MKSNLLHTFCAFLLLVSCTKTIPSTHVLNINNIESSFITIRTGSVYHLKTSKGTRITIDSGTFSADRGKTITIEIKEAIAAADIVAAGLTTMSNGKPLKSGGMIYFDAKTDGKKATFNKPVKISVPTARYEQDMQLFKGTYTEDSSLNWVDPQPLDSGAFYKALWRGSAVFTAACANCHKPVRDFSGPALAGTYSRIPSKKWLYDFIRSPASMHDAYARQLKEHWKPVIMTAFPQLEKETIDDIMLYVENYAAFEPERIRSALPAATNTPEPFCWFDTVYTTGQNTDSNNAATLYNIRNTSKADTLNNAGNMADDPYIPRGRYEFSISAPGWYNVDAYLDAGTTPVSLIVEIKTNKEINMDVYLFCPLHKIFMQGSKQSGGAYVFKDDDGNIPLFLNDKAVILATGGKEDKLYYGTAAFSIAGSQVITIDVKETTEAKLFSFMKTNKIDAVTLDIYTNEKIIKPVPCDTATPAPGANAPNTTSAP